MRRAPRVGKWGFNAENEMIDPTSFGLMRFDGSWSNLMWRCGAGAGDLGFALWPCCGVSCCDRMSPQSPPEPNKRIDANGTDTTPASCEEAFQTKTCHQPMQTLDFQGEAGYQLMSFQANPHQCSDKQDDCKELFYATWGFDVRIGG